MKEKLIVNRKGMWKRFFKMLAKSNLPYGMIAVLLIVSIVGVNIGVDETDMTAQLFDGDVRPEFIARLIGVILLNILLSKINYVVDGVTSARIQRNVRLSVWDKLLSVPMRFFQGTEPQNTISRVVNDSTTICSAVTMVFIPLITSLYGIVACLKQVANYDYRLSMTLFLSIPIQFFVAWITGKLTFTVNEKQTDVRALLTQKISELIRFIPVTKAFAKEAEADQHGQVYTEQFRRVDVRSGWIGSFTTGAMSIIELLQVGVLFVVAMLLFQNDMITKRAWIVFFTFSGLVTGHAANLVVLWSNTKVIQGTIERVGEIMDEKAEGGGNLPADTLSDDIVLRDVFFGYTEEKNVFTGLNATIRVGRVTGLLGESGCGKTTLVHLIDRIYDPSSGTVTIGGTDTREFELNSFRRQFAIASQDTMLFSGTLRENLLFGARRPFTDEELFAFLDRVELSQWVREKEEGLDFPVGEFGAKLSGGQKQKLALARALMADTPYLILDEATAAMDMISVSGIRRYLKQYCQGKTVIIIAHTPSLLDLFDDVIVLRNGKAACQGTLTEVSQTDPFLKDFIAGGGNHG